MTESLLTIAVLHWAVLLVPGFNFLLIGQLAASGSRRAAFAAVTGMTCATLLWAILAVAGVGAVFGAHPGLRLAAQALGGLYLVYLGFGLLRAANAGPASQETTVAGHRAAFRAGFVTGVLNPKIALFYGSVFATALPARPSSLHVAAAVAMVYANSWLWHATLAVALSRPSVQRAYLAHGRTLTRAAGALVVLFGARLIVTAIQEAQLHFA